MNLPPRLAGHHDRRMHPRICAHVSPTENLHSQAITITHTSAHGEYLQVTAASSQSDRTSRSRGDRGDMETERVRLRERERTRDRLADWPAPRHLGLAWMQPAHASESSFPTSCLNVLHTIKPQLHSACLYVHSRSHTDQWFRKSGCRQPSLHLPIR